MTKILTVDDSKAVRMVVRKTFKDFDCEIIEASNGVEGLATAGREDPDIILLDVTMPVMDGVEMLTKLKTDPKTKGIPVIMLTAEAGRDNVLRIAKIGIRDYIVKPFQDKTLVDKVDRIIDLRPKGEKEQKRKSIHDACEIMIVEDKQTIVEQIQSGLAHTPWNLFGVASTGEAIDKAQHQVPDAIIISLSLPDENAFTLFRILRSNLKTKYVPCFSLAVKTAVDEQKMAQQVGFNAHITKPIDFDELEMRLAKAINLDTSERYFQFNEDFLVIKIPGNYNEYMLNEVSAYLAGSLSKAVDSGFYKVLVDVSEITSLNMNLIKILMNIMKSCQELTVNYALIGNDDLMQDCKGFEESRGWQFFKTFDEAKAQGLSAVSA